MTMAFHQVEPLRRTGTATGRRRSTSTTKRIRDLQRPPQPSEREGHHQYDLGDIAFDIASVLTTIYY